MYCLSASIYLLLNTVCLLQYDGMSLQIFSFVNWLYLQLLSTVVWNNLSQETDRDGLKPENVHKNRNKDLVPRMLAILLIIYYTFYSL